jgi:hypothetical protein
MMWPKPTPQGVGHSCLAEDGEEERQCRGPVAEDTELRVKLATAVPIGVDRH